MGRPVHLGYVNLCNLGLGLIVAGKAVEFSGSLGTALLKSGLHCCFMLIKCLELHVSAHIKECKVPRLENP